MLTIQGRTADEAWRAVVAKVREAPPQASRGGPTKELLHVALEIELPQQRWTLSREPAINPAFAIAEVIWILSGRADAAFLNYWNPLYSRFAGKGLEYHGAYGRRLRSAFGLDQIERAYRAFDSDPDTRQVVLQIWDAARDLPREDGRPAAEDIPCNICGLLKVRDGALHWTQVMRSNDAFRGLPYNLVQFTSLQAVLAGWLGLKVGPYHQWSDSLHAYDSAATIFSIEGGSPPTDTGDHPFLSRSKWQATFPRVAAIAESFVQRDLTRATLQHALASGSDLEEWQSYISLLAADASRRRDWSDLITASLKSCPDETLRTLGERWVRSAKHPGHTVPTGSSAENSPGNQ